VLFLGELVFGQWHLMGKNLENPVRKKINSLVYFPVNIGGGSSLLFHTARAFLLYHLLLVARSNFSCVKIKYCITKRMPVSHAKCLQLII
jgi:hypothetical protein